MPTQWLSATVRSVEKHTVEFVVVVANGRKRYSNCRYPSGCVTPPCRWSTSILRIPPSVIAAVLATYALTCPGSSSLVIVHQSYIPPSAQVNNANIVDLGARHRCVVREREFTDRRKTDEKSSFIGDNTDAIRAREIHHSHTASMLRSTRCFIKD
jgi:hypothetical protein